MTITPNDANYTPSKHFSNLASVASQYVRDELGVSYNHRGWDSFSTNMKNSSYGTSKGGVGRIAKGLNHAASAMGGGTGTEVYYRNTSGSPSPCCKPRDVSKIPLDGEVPGAYQVYPYDKH